MLKLTGITKDYKVADSKVQALKGIDLEFRKNEFVCILGPSGCGKTTLLNIIGGLDQYTTGDLIIQGKSTKDFSDHDWDVYRNHRIGFIFQSYNLIPHQTILQNVEIALTIAGVDKQERRDRAVKALERVGLADHLNKRPNQLSGGQMQRVAIARALVNNPAILLADEPTGALDSETSVQIMELIREISGERLVIMVTHNPELAQAYATRIVSLKDGKVLSDTDPYEGGEEEPVVEVPVESASEPVEAEVIDAQSEADGAKKKRKKKEKKPRASMSFFTSLALSARNLLTKKGRTIVTAIAGSIGIISVCLVLALSNGFSKYITKTEEDMLSHYPLTVTETSLDMTSIMGAMTSSKEMPDLDKIGDRVYVNSFLTGLAQGLMVTNNISDEYISYLEDMDPNLYYAIQYNYGVTLSDNLFTNVATGATQAELKKQNMSLSELKEFYTVELTTRASEYGQLAYLVDYLGSIVSKMPGTEDPSAEGYGDYVLSQYDIIAGEFPKNENEAVLVVGGNNDATDLTLAQLGFISEPDFLSLFELGEKATGTKEDGYMAIPYKDILGKQFTLFYNDAVYTKSADPTGQYPFTYQGTRASLDAAEGEGINVHVSGILRLKDGLNYGCLTSGLNLTEKVVRTYIENNMKSEFVKWMTSDEAKKVVTVEGSDPVTIYLAPSENLTKEHYKYVYEDNVTIPGVGTIPVKVRYCPEQLMKNALRSVGGEDSVSGISFYPRDFETKDKVVAYLDAWNDARQAEDKTEDKVTYTDQVGILMSMVQTMLNAITYVLVAFTAISLVVSSVMIGIITYVSVVERVKEIGVLRSLGARKRDIRNLFNAETFIIGLAAGVFGVVVTYLLSFAVNAILVALTGISGLAQLNPIAALIMIAISVVLTLISGLIPASKAAKQDPVVALRTE